MQHTIDSKKPLGRRTSISKCKIDFNSASENCYLGLAGEKASFVNPAVFGTPTVLHLLIDDTVFACFLAL